MHATEKRLQASFFHSFTSANADADRLSNEEIGLSCLAVENSYLLALMILVACWLVNLLVFSFSLVASLMLDSFLLIKLCCHSKNNN